MDGNMKLKNIVAFVYHQSVYRVLELHISPYCLPLLKQGRS